MSLEVNGINTLVNKVASGALLHDIGKVVQRASRNKELMHSIVGREYLETYIEDKDILDCVSYHHRQRLTEAKVAPNSPAYVVYLANNISSGFFDYEHEEELEDSWYSKSLDCIYNILNNQNKDYIYPLHTMKEDKPHYPESGKAKGQYADYDRLLSDYSQGLKDLKLKPEYLNSLLELNEAYLSFVPASAQAGEPSDISLYDHSKTTAAIAACIVLYLEGKGIQDYRETLFDQEDSFYDLEAFSIVSLDISGIQQFIYNIPSDGALKSLRSRSFYLEIMLENVTDEILNLYKLPKANLIYSGGGHAYILLPHLPEKRDELKAAIANMNKQLLKMFGTALFIAYGYQSCSAKELMSITDKPESYSDIFRSLGCSLAQDKLRRYSAEQLLDLNSLRSDTSGRECHICGKTASLTEFEDKTVCSICLSFIQLSNELIKPNTVYAVLRQQPASPSLQLLSATEKGYYLLPVKYQQAMEILKKEPDNVVRFYSKNTYRTDLPYSSRIWMGDFSAKTEDGNLKTFAELAEASQGIERIGVLRADVDSLGSAFLRGFVREEQENKYKYVNITRTSALSRSLSAYFKYFINGLLAESKGSLLTGEDKNEVNIVVVYSGGDDMFLVGAWDEVLSCGIELQRSFSRYTGGALTLSAGFGVFPPKYPISQMAQETAKLEEKAKEHTHQYGQKNSISLFGLEMEGGRLEAKHTYDWDTFENKVIAEKLRLLQNLSGLKEDTGNTFLYSILYLLRQAGERINVARLAYLLARHKPDRRAPKEVHQAYEEFTRQVYRWSLDKEERQQLITAMQIYIYTRRQSKEEG